MLGSSFLREQKVDSLKEFCDLVEAGEHDVPDSEVQEAKTTFKQLVPQAAEQHLGFAQDRVLAAKSYSKNFATVQAKKDLKSAVGHYKLFLKCVAWGAAMPLNKVEDAHIALATALFGLKLSRDALDEATAFTTEYPEHKRPLMWMIRAYILHENREPEPALEAYLAARMRYNALQPHEQGDEVIGKDLLTIHALARKFPRQQQAPGKSPRSAKRQRTDQPMAATAASSSSSSAPLPAEMCETGLEKETLTIEELVHIRVASMEDRIKKKQDHFLRSGPTEKQLLFYGEQAEECIGSWSDDHVDEADLLNLWYRQDRWCALSGERMSTRTNDPNVGSVDRKDSRRGYTADNVQWVCAWVNYMKSSMPEGLFFHRCMTLGNRYTKWSMKKMADMEEQVRSLKRNRETSEMTDEAEEQAKDKEEEEEEVDQ